MDKAQSTNIPTEDPQPTHTSKVSVVSVHCRICYDDEKPEELMTPFQCKGTMAFVHRSCLETWLGESGLTSCELCNQPFKTERIPKYTSTESIWNWLKYGFRYPETSLRGDVITCGIINPLAIIVTYICLYSSEHYGHQRFSFSSKLTAVCLFLVIGILFLGYYLWVTSVVRAHSLVWYSWWQRSCIVRYIAPSTISLNSKTQDQVNVPNNTPCCSRQFSRTEALACSESDSLTTVVIHSEVLPSEDEFLNNGDSQDSCRTEAIGNRGNDSLTTVIHFRALVDADLSSQDSIRNEVLGGSENDASPSVINVDASLDDENLTRTQNNAVEIEKIVRPCNDISSYSKDSTRAQVLGCSESNSSKPLQKVSLHMRMKL